MIHHLDRDVRQALTEVGLCHCERTQPKGRAKFQSATGSELRRRNDDLRLALDREIH